jgi:hypothetical protein
VTTRISRNDLCPCGSGRKYKVCCLRKWFRDDVPRIQRPGADGASLSNYTQQIRFNRIKPEPEPESVTRVELTYVSENGFGTAEVSFAYLLGTPIIMRNGSVLQAELIERGMQFRLEDGGYATVTHAEPPKEYECPSKSSGIVVGKVKYSGRHPRMDMRVSGELIQSTPGHLFWSPTRRAWEPLENFRAGEYLSNRNGDPVPIDWISSVYWEFGDLYNLEVEDAHTYFVGGGDHGGILTHNGLDMGCRVPRAAIAERGSFNIASGYRINGLRETTMAEMQKAFRGTGLTPTRHFFERASELRTFNQGVRTYDDLQSIIRKGSLVNADRGERAFVLNGMAIVFDPVTGRLITLRPW